MADTAKKKATTVAAANFVSKIVEDPASPPAVVLLTGYPGGSAGEGTSRFYLSPDLAFWLDVPSEAVVHVQDIDSSQNPLGAVAVWVRQDAKVTGGNRWSTGA